MASSVQHNLHPCRIPPCSPGVGELEPQHALPELGSCLNVMVLESEDMSQEVQKVSGPLNHDEKGNDGSDNLRAIALRAGTFSG